MVLMISFLTSTSIKDEIFNDSHDNVMDLHIVVRAATS